MTRWAFNVFSHAAFYMGLRVVYIGECIFEKRKDNMPKQALAAHFLGNGRTRKAVRSDD